jgi:type I restriction enzyme M protein
MLFIDARILGEMVTRRLRAFSEEDIAKVANAYHQWRNVGGSHQDIDGFCKSSMLEEVEQQKYVLTPGRYVGNGAEEDDGIPFEEKMVKLTQKLREQFSQSNNLQQEIKQNLKKYFEEL